MHPIWNIPELLAHILSFLDEKSDILRCTLVCRSLSVEATRQIWRQVSAFRDLLGCFPNNIISTETSGPSWRLVRTFLFLGLPTTSEWDHMRLRANMVKELTFPKLENYDAVLDVIQDHKIDLVFPELVSLHVHASVDTILQSFLPLFAPSRLQELEITFEWFNDHSIDTTMAALLAQAHPLRTLEIGAMSFPKASQETLMQLLETTKSINSLRLTLMISHGQEIVQAAAQLPNLQALNLEFNGYNVTQNEYPPGFQSLISLKMWSPYIYALWVVRAITSPNISKLHLDLRGGPVGSSRSLFEAMAPMSNLKSVSCTFVHSRSLQWTDVEPLLSCPSISDCLIEMAGPGMEIDDAILSAISRAWPNLNRLKLDGNENASKRFRRPSLRGLAELLGRCPKLQLVIVEVNAKARRLQVPLANATPASSKPRGKLLLNIRRSRIPQGSENIISEYLMSIWPGQCEVISRWEEHEWQGDTWEKVGELIEQRE